MEKRVVVAVGGNALMTDSKHPEIEQQWQAVARTAEQVAALVAAGWQVVVTHGNGPQAGFMLRRNELAAAEVYCEPLDVINADTQGAIGYMLQQALGNALRARGMARSVATVVTQVVVDRDDPGFASANKPVGGYVDATEAERLRQAGWVVTDDAGRGFRRRVASPLPMAVVELAAIEALLVAGTVVIAGGGGGIPVVWEDGSLRGVNAVIDKDRTSALLADALAAEVLLIATSVDRVAVNFGQPDERWLDAMTVAEAEGYLAAGEFAAGSMGPKVEAAVAFVDGRGGRRAVICGLEGLLDAVAGQAGTAIYATMG